VVPYGVPAAPANLGGAANGTSITWTWQAPNMNGGSFVRYEYRVDGQGSWTSQTGTSVSRNFSCEESHWLQVRAVNTGPAGEKTGGESRTGNIATSTCPRPPTVSISFLPQLASNQYCPNCQPVQVTVSNFAPGNYTVTCDSSIGPEGFVSFTIAVDGNGNGSRNSDNYCEWGNGITAWVFVNGVRSDTIGPHN
jgi:hypothetical protein